MLLNINEAQCEKKRRKKDNQNGDFRRKFNG